MMFNVVARPAAAAVCAAALFLSTAVSAQTAEGPPQRVIVKWKNNTVSLAARSGLATQAMSQAGSRIGVSMQRVRTIATGAEVVSANRRLSRSEFDQMIRTLKSDPNVEYAEEDVMLRPSMVPNDARYGDQWQYFATASGINAQPAWDITNGAGVIVAVIDTGYRPHADLAANIVGGYDFISDTFVSRDGDARDSDARDPGDWTLAADCPPYSPTISSWHGTHVAGTVAAVTNNGTGVAGVAFGGKVLPLRVLGRCGGLTSDIADAIIWASGGTVSGVPNNTNVAKVINLSLGSPPDVACASTTQAAIDSARSRGSVVVVAAGNENVNANRVTPARCSGVVVVAAVARSGSKAGYSNFGAIVDLAAPGGTNNGVAANDVLSTLNTGTTTPVNDAYAAYPGTSMAAPHVAGVAALMLSVNSSLSPDEVEAGLKDSTRAFSGTCSQCGTGLLDALGAVNVALGEDPDPPGACPTGFTEYTGSLSEGASAYAPSTAGVATPAGMHSGRLTGPASADFDLYLQRRSGSSWRIVARAEGTTSTESIDFNGTANTYRWRVFAYDGSGTYSLCVKRP